MDVAGGRMNNKTRYTKAVISPINVGLVTNRNPYIIMWWAAAFPGFPQLSMCKYISGTILILWEVIINMNAKLNLALMYSFTGQFELATKVLDTRWILMYIPVYIYGIWDSRRLVMNGNKFAILADSIGSYEQIQPTKITWFDNNMLDKLRPAIAAFWSFIFPGLGHMYIYRLPSAVGLISWIVIISYFSHLLPAVHLTFQGQFDKAASIVDPQWFLFLPSLWGFGIFDAYVFCKKQNDLFINEQSRYLVKHNQPQDFNAQFFSKRDGEMNIVASFSSSLYVELAINELKQNGIINEDIFAIPLSEQQKNNNINAINGEGFLYFEVAISSGTAFSVIGAIYGFIWYGGPVLWGLAGFFFGSLLGLTIDLIIERKKLVKKLKKGKGGEVMLIVKCNKERAKMVKDILFDHFTLGVSEVDFNHTKNFGDSGL